MWSCPKCGADVEASFDVCWSCGTSRDGVEDPDFQSADEVGPIYDPPVKLEPDLAGAPELELPEPPLELVECYRARDAAEAKFLVDRLVERGIAAVANQTHLGTTEYAFGIFTPRIMVRAQDYSPARAFVQEYEERLRARRAEA